MVGKFIKSIFHPLTHQFIQRQLVWEMVDGGGATYGLGCPDCGDIEWIDFERGLELRRVGGNAMHTDEFYEIIDQRHEDQP